MPLPTPEPGLVICYEFLWSREHTAGQADGEKRRPCAIVLTDRNQNNQTIVTVIPISHSPPRNPARAVEIPEKIKTHLGLDRRRQWIVLDELNEFQWPGRYVYPIHGSWNVFEHGFLPPAFFEQIRKSLLVLADKKVTLRES